jgi:hypothetical protein
MREHEPSKPPPPKKRKGGSKDPSWPVLSITRVPPEEGISQIPGNYSEETEVIDDTNKRRGADD